MGSHGQCFSDRGFFRAGVATVSAFLTVGSSGHRDWHLLVGKAHGQESADRGYPHRPRDVGVNRKPRGYTLGRNGLEAKFPRGAWTTTQGKILRRKNRSSE